MSDKADSPVSATGETPRTDAVVARGVGQRWPAIVDLARQLERELAEARATAPTDLYIGGWNDAMQVAADVLRSSADNCLPGSPAEAQNWPFVLEQMARKIEKRKGQPSAPSSTPAIKPPPSDEVKVAERICALYFDIAEEVVGADEVRRRFKERFGRELEPLPASTQDIDGRIASSRMSDHRDMAEEAARVSAERTTKWDLVADKLSTINGLSDDEYETVNAAAQYLRECGAVHAHARSAPKGGLPAAA